MGRLELIPLAPSPSALWDWQSRRLTITGSKNFDPEARVPKVGFEKPHEHEQDFENWEELDQVYIHAGNGTFGAPVAKIYAPASQGNKEVQATPLSPRSNRRSLMSAAALPTKPTQTEQVKVANDIYAIIGFPFDIKQTAQVPRGGEIDINFDSSSLTLEKAGIKDVDLYWRFNPIQSGQTQVKVTVYGGQIPYIMDIVYNVHVLFIDGASSPKASALTGSDVHIPEAVWRFRVGTAMDRVHQKWPEAKLYDVHARAPNHKGVDSTFELTEMVCNFFLPDMTQIFIMSTGLFDWKKPIHLAMPLIGVEELPVPQDLSGERAVELLRNQGFTGKFIQLAMAWSRNVWPGGRQKVYLFEMEDGPQHEITYDNVEDPKKVPATPIDPAKPVADANGVASTQPSGAVPPPLIAPVTAAAATPAFAQPPPPLVGVAA